MLYDNESQILFITWQEIQSENGLFQNEIQYKKGSLPAALFSCLFYMT